MKFIMFIILALALTGCARDRFSAKAIMTQCSHDFVIKTTKGSVEGRYVYWKLYCYNESGRKILSTYSGKLDLVAF